MLIIRQRAENGLYVDPKSSYMNIFSRENENGSRMSKYLRESISDLLNVNSFGVYTSAVDIIFTIIDSFRIK